MLNKLYPLIIALGLTAVLGACENEGPAERAGAEIDQTVEQAQEKVEEVMDEPNEGPAEEMGEKLDEAAEETQEAVEEAQENVEETMQ